MKGDKVIVQAFGGKPLVRRVWDVSSDTVFICTEENYNTLLNDEDGGLWPVGFPKEFVFRYNPNVDMSDPQLFGQLDAYV